MRSNTIKKRLQDGEIFFGVMAQEFATPGFPTITANTGTQFVVYDMEHTGWTLETIKMLIACGQGTDLIPMVRVPTAEYHWVAHVLDVGACGLVIPLVHNEQILQRAVDAAFYPPIGKRGCSFGLLHDNFGSTDLPRMMREANESLLLIAQIESSEGVENIDAICRHAQVDAIWIGGYDLSCSLGAPGDFESLKYRDCVSKVLECCRQNSIPTVLGANNVQALEAGVSAGHRIIVYTSDIAVYANALQECRQRILR